MSQSILSLLAEFRRRQAAEQLRAGTASKGSGLIFSKESGRPVDLNTLKIEVKAAIKRASHHATLRVNDLQHTFASILMAGGLNPKVVAERLGHSNVSMTCRPTLT